MGAIADVGAEHSLRARAKVAPAGVRSCKGVPHDTQRRCVGEDARARGYGARQWPHLFAAHPPLLRLILWFALLCSASPGCRTSAQWCLEPSRLVRMNLCRRRLNSMHAHTALFDWIFSLSLVEDMTAYLYKVV